jgi:hypothetical protein
VRRHPTGLTPNLNFWQKFIFGRKHPEQPREEARRTRMAQELQPHKLPQVDCFHVIFFWAKNQFWSLIIIFIINTMAQ